MKKISVLSVFVLILSLTVSAQVKIGHDALSPVYNAAALLELNNDPAATVNTWKSLLLPYVDFTDAAFTDSATWGIAGTHTAGALVFNTGNRITDGFEGPGVYVWSEGAWVPLKETVISNAPGVCSDPGPNTGDEGCVVFTYRNGPVIHKTVRAADGRIWLKQNLGSLRVAIALNDSMGYGHYFQWGRGDDGHQLRTSPSALTSTLPVNNPTGLPPGTDTFYRGTSTIADNWWQTGTTNDSVSANPPTANNGIDPCTALGAGWRLPTQAEWSAVVSAENITNTSTAYASTLKLTAPGQRARNTGNMSSMGTVAGYWSKTPQSDSYIYYLILMSSNADPTYNMYRGQGMSCRCIKD